MTNEPRTREDQAIGHWALGIRISPGGRICYPKREASVPPCSRVSAIKKSVMALDAYAPCPCGSGKKFKWCCQPIRVQIDKAFQQDAEGQHEAALRLMDEVVDQNPANPEGWGRKAQLLYQNNRVDEAETTLQ